MWPKTLELFSVLTFGDSGGSPTQRGGCIGMPPSTNLPFPAKALALQHSKEIVILTPSLCTFSPSLLMNVT